jgi:hypothetical protein
LKSCRYIGEAFYTSDYDLSSFSSHFAGAGFKYSPALCIGEFKLSKKANKPFIIRELQLRAGSYYRSVGMNSMHVSLGASFFVLENIETIFKQNRCKLHFV